MPQGKWEPDIHHHRKADDLGAGLEITKLSALCHGAEPRTRPPTAQGWFNLTMPILLHLRAVIYQIRYLNDPTFTYS